MPFVGMFHMSLDYLLNLCVSLIELLTDSIALTENAIIIMTDNSFRHECVRSQF